MRLKLAAACALLLTGRMPASAHRLDEYLQATIFTVEKDHVGAQLRLIPGVAVCPAVLAGIDSNGDGILAEAEQSAYAERVLHDLSLSLDGVRLRLKLRSARFAGIGEMKEGLGEIQLEFQADLPPAGSNRRLVFENHHQSRMAAYLVNTLVPHNPGIRVTAQNRNPDQSRYELDYVQAGVAAGPWSLDWWSGGRLWTGAVALILLARLAWLSRGAHRRMA